MRTPASKSGSRGRAWAIRIAGTALFLLLLLWLDNRGDLSLADIWATLSRADVPLVLLSIVMYVPFLAVKTARWRLVSADMRMPVTWGDAWRIYAIGLAAGTFTPGQAGDTLKAWYLERKGYPLGRAFGGSVLDRLFDVAALAVIGLVGVAVYGQRFAGQTPALVAWALACAVLLGLAAYNPTRTWAVNMVRGRMSRLRGRGSDPQKVEPWSLRRSTLGWVVGLTFAGFALSILRVWLLAGAVGVWLGPLQVAGYVGLTTAAALVPVSVGGIGTRDAVSALALSQVGYAATDGIAVSALILLLNATQAVAGWLVWLRYRSDGRDAASETLEQTQPARARGNSASR
jgi:glycosyltransferase 2 family protein